MVPENADPLWVNCQVRVPAAAAGVPDPIIEPVESDAAPTQVPVKVAVELGPESAADCALHAAAVALPMSAKNRKNQVSPATPESC